MKPQHNIVPVSFFHKRESELIKGSAMILMVIHHFWGFPDWILNENTYVGILWNSQYLEHRIGIFGKICVSMFVFVTGYAVYINWDNYSCFKSRLIRVLRFLINYWIFSFTFLIIGYFLNEPLPDVFHFIANLLGLSTGVFNYGNGYICVTMAWYVSFYIPLMFILPIFIIHTKKNFFFDTFLMITLFRIMLFIYEQSNLKSLAVINQIFPNLLKYTPVFLIGYFIAEYKIYEKLTNHLSTNIVVRLILSSSTCIIIILLRISITEIEGIYLDTIYAPVFIFSLAIIYKDFAKYFFFKYPDKTLRLIGCQSMNLWFIHGIFFTPYRNLQFIAYWPKQSILIIIWILALLIPLCLLVSNLQNRIWNLLISRY